MTKTRTLLVTVDSLRRDHLRYMPNTYAALDHWHDRAIATSTATLGSFPGIISGVYPGEPEVNPDQTVTNAFNCHCLGITTNHLLSERYGYNAGFDQFTSPHSAQSLKDDLGRQLTIGSKAYKLASTGYALFQGLRERISGVKKSFRPAEDVIEEFYNDITRDDEWFAWLHFMEPHYPYDPNGAEMKRSQAQSLTRRVLANNGTPTEEEQVRSLYRQEVEELDDQLSSLWSWIPDDTRVVFCADHGEMLGEADLWGHPGEVRPELLHIPFGTRNVPDMGNVVSHVDVPSLLIGEEWGEGMFDREIAYASYGGAKAAVNGTHIASEETTMTLDGEPDSAPNLERALSSFNPESVVKEDAVKEDLEALGYT